MKKTTVMHEYTIKAAYDKDIDKIIIVALQNGRFYNQGVLDVTPEHRAMGMEKATDLVEQQLIDSLIAKSTPETLFDDKKGGE